MWWRPIGQFNYLLDIVRAPVQWVNRDPPLKELVNVKKTYLT